MHLILKKLCAVLVLLILSTSAYAGLILDRTRIIYEEGAQSQKMFVTNEGASLVAVQSWTETLDGGTTPFVVSPSITTLDTKEKKPLLLVQVKEVEPHDKPQETLYYFIYKDAPKSNGSKQVIGFSVATQLKLIYRPDAIKNGRQGAEDNIELERMANGRLKLTNPTPYYFALSHALAGKPLHKVMLPSNARTIPPYHSVEFDLGEDTDRLAFEYLNDYGASKQTDLIKIKQAG